MAGGREQTAPRQSSGFRLGGRSTELLLDVPSPADVLKIDRIPRVASVDAAFDPCAERLGEGFKSRRKRVPHDSKPPAMAFSIPIPHIRKDVSDPLAYQLLPRLLDQLF